MKRIRPDHGWHTKVARSGALPLAGIHKETLCANEQCFVGVRREERVMLRLIFVLAAWGFAGLILVGPAIAVLAIALSLIVAVVATLAPFVLLGLLFYLPYRLLFVRDFPW